jgi:hypothetical protein
MADEEKVEFKVGGFCRVSATTVAKIPDMTPVRLLKNGWPNKFLIIEIYDDEEKGKLLRLDPCCGWMRDLKKEEETACEAHPAKYFEPLPGHIQDQEDGEEAEEDPQGRRYSGFGQDEEGEDAVGVEYVRNGGKTGSFFFRRAGERPIVVRGQAADKLLRAVKKLGIL